MDQHIEPEVAAVQHLVDASYYRQHENEAALAKRLGAIESYTTVSRIPSEDVNAGVLRALASNPEFKLIPDVVQVHMDADRDEFDRRYPDKAALARRLHRNKLHRDTAAVQQEASRKDDALVAALSERQSAALHTEGKRTDFVHSKTPAAINNITVPEPRSNLMIR